MVDTISSPLDYEYLSVELLSSQVNCSMILLTNLPATAALCPDETPHGYGNLS